MSSGGGVGYYNAGDIVKSIGSLINDAIPNLGNVFSTFSQAVTSLSNMELGVTVNKPIDVNVRLLNDNILKVIDEKIANATLDAVAAEIPKHKTNMAGQTTRSESLMPK